nr:hypothetical protein GCM10020092_055830 [Actinoplanes digitatis]
MLRTMALDEELKARIPGDPVLGPLARKVAARYVAGETTAEALARVAEVLGRGHRANAEYMGESCRDPERVGRETDVFVDLARRLPSAARSPSTCRTSAWRSPTTSPSRTARASPRPPPPPGAR